MKGIRTMPFVSLLLLLTVVLAADAPALQVPSNSRASFVVDLDLTGRASTVLVGAVPPGAYERLTFNMHKPEDDEAAPDPDFKAGSSGHQRFSVIVRGDAEGTPFVRKVRDSMRQRVAFSPPFRVREGDDPVVVTLLADVDQWFVGRGGQALDPRRDDDVEAIADAIQASFRALGNEGGARASLCVLTRLKKNTTPWVYVPFSEGTVLRAA